MFNRVVEENREEKGINSLTYTYHYRLEKRCSDTSTSSQQRISATMRQEDSELTNPTPVESPGATALLRQQRVAIRCNGMALLIFGFRSLDLVVAW